MKTVFAILLAALCLGCGYRSPKTTPPVAGVTPNISALVPNNVNANSAGFVLTVNGTSFNSNAEIKWNGTSQNTTVVTGNQLTANIPASMVTTPGTVQVTVENPGMSGGIYGGGTMAETSNAMTFTIN